LVIGNSYSSRQGEEGHCSLSGAVPWAQRLRLPAREASPWA